MHKPFPACDACIVKPMEFDEEERIRFPIYLPCAGCAASLGLPGCDARRIPVAAI